MKKTKKSPRKRPLTKKNQKFFHLRTSELRKKAKKNEKKFCQFGKRLYFCNPKTRESDERGIGARSLKETETGCSVPAVVSRGRPSGRQVERVGKKDNSEEILTMKSLILAQDER